jgi:hypothetical protein
MAPDDEAQPEPSGLLGRFSRRQLRLAGVVVVGVLVAIILVATLVGRRGGKLSDNDLEHRLKDEIADAVDDAKGGGVDLSKLDDRLDRARGEWVISLAASDDRRTVGVAARQPDGPDCLLVWSAVGGARSALVTDPNLPCRGQIALAAAG